MVLPNNKSPKIRKKNVFSNTFNFHYSCQEHEKNVPPDSNRRNHYNQFNTHI